LVRKAIKPVADEIRAFLKKAGSGAPGKRHVAVKYLRQVEPDVAAFLALRVCLNAISSRSSLQNLAVSVGSALETEIKLAAFEEADPQAFGRAAKIATKSSNEHYRRIIYSHLARKNQVDIPAWPKGDKLQLGLRLIEMVIDATGYLEIIVDYKKGKGKLITHSYHVIGSAKCLEWMQRLEDTRTAR
jgi:DNA-directed RNA polymerase